ncbi:MAG: DUF3592 domain-containing protein [Gemmatimonadetes bacterium]|nr:DUF3592 domain-containing protein [Gemmatimonadota bacterium]
MPQTAPDPRPLTPRARLWSLLWAAIAFAIATSMLRTMVTEWPQTRASRSWPTAPGTIITATLDSARNSRGTTRYYPVLAYTFRLADSTYRGTALRLGTPSFHTVAEGEQALRPYGEGATVPVHYDPGNPTLSVLELRTLTWADRLLIPTALVALGIGVFSAWEGITGATPRLRWPGRR